MHEFNDLKTTMDQIVAYEQVFRKRMAKTMTPEKFAAIEKDPVEPEEPEEPGRDFVMERAKLEADREDAEEHRRELAREDFERRMEKMREMKGD